MNSTDAPYGKRSSGLGHGDVFTLPEVVRFMLDNIGYSADKDLSEVCILEPSFGTGEFLLEIQNRLIESSHRYQFDASDAFDNFVFACEIDKKKYDIAVARLREQMPLLSARNLKNEDFLFSEWPVDFDFIIGNPPYVRYENIPENVRDIYKKKFSTFHYRCDLYVLFYEHSLRYLASKGKHCFICSNRWLKNEYGKLLRKLIIESYNLEQLVDVENLNAFQEEVLAYPAISVISGSANQYAIKTAKVDDIELLAQDIPYATKRYNSYDDFADVFSELDTSNLLSVEDLGYQVGIGVATGADGVFISRDIVNQAEPEVTIPIINARDLSGDIFNWGGRYLLNPYDKFGNPIDLELYPKAKEYLLNNKTVLERRHVVKNKRIWYLLIDKIKPNLQSEPKILLPDISANKRIFVDSGRYYPAHNIYYILSKEHSEEALKLLAAILMSEFVRDQITRLSNKMNGGFPRWQSQTIRKLRLPDIREIPNGIKISLIKAYEIFDLEKINKIVSELLKCPVHRKKTTQPVVRQLSFF